MVWVLYTAGSFRQWFCPQLCCSVRGCVRPPKWSDLLQNKIKMFLDRPSVVSLHVGRWKVKAQGQGCESVEVVFGINAVANSPTYFKKRPKCPSTVLPSPASCWSLNGQSSSQGGPFTSNTEHNIPVPGFVPRTLDFFYSHCFRLQLFYEQIHFCISLVFGKALTSVFLHNSLKYKPIKVKTSGNIDESNVWR